MKVIETNKHNNVIPPSGSVLVSEVFEFGPRTRRTSKVHDYNKEQGL